MQVHFSMDQLPEIPFPVVTMGSFDGVHAGHRVIIERLNTLAGSVESGGSSVLITFHPHPRKVLYPETAGKELRLITTLEEKCSVLEETGLDHLIVLEFTRDFARTTSEEFVENYLVGKLHAHTIVVGFNHFFGHNKEGNFNSLYAVSERFGFTVEEIPSQEIQNETVSSTKIRKALGEGHIQRANAYLEHHFIMKAEMLAAGKGSAGLERSFFEMKVEDPNKLILPDGSYAVSFSQGRKFHKGLVRIGERQILLFPVDKDCRVIEDAIVHFHKHLPAGGLDRLEAQIGAVMELIY